MPDIYRFPYGEKLNDDQREWLMRRGQESRVRSLARRRGYWVTKSRARKTVPAINNHGLFMLVDDCNTVVLGERYDATLDEIESFLTGGWIDEQPKPAA
jgi:hypothetical protein